MGNRIAYIEHRPYTRDEIDFLQDSAEEIQNMEGRKEIAKQIGRSPGSVYFQAKRLGLIKARREQATGEEIFYKRRRANLRALKSMTCTRCGEPLIIQRDPLDVFDFRLFGVICGHSFYFLAEDFKKLKTGRNEQLGGLR